MTWSDDLVEQRRPVVVFQIGDELPVDIRVLAEQGEGPGQQGGRCVVAGDQHGQHLVADGIVVQAGVDQVLEKVRSW